MSYLSLASARRLNIALLVITSACSSTREGLESSDAVVIAHRGASGHAPEHTLEAYSMGHAMGADFIEPDLVMCRDGYLICSHDLTVRKESNAASLYPDLVNEAGEVMIRDLFYAELKKVNFSDEAGEGSYRYASFVEFLDLMVLLGQRTGKKVGVIPELKAPAWHRSEDLPMEAELIARLAEAGYGAPSDPVIVQCFDKESLRRIRVEHECPLPQVLCLRKDFTEEDLAWAAEFCDGVAPHRSSIEDAQTGEASGLVERAHALGLAVFPYTFEDEELAMRRYLYEHRVQGVFTNFPDAGVAARAKP